MSRVSLKGICDMHVHTNPDLRHRAYSDLELADAAVRVGARAIVIKSHLGFTVNRAAIATEYVQKRYGDKTNFTMFGKRWRAFLRKQQQSGLFHRQPLPAPKH